MNSSEFKRLLGADPASQDPEFLRARDSSPEHAEAAAAADRLERLLRGALDVPVPPDLAGRLRDLPQRHDRNPRMLPLALAAGLVLALAAGFLVWRPDPAPDSVEDYVAQHFHHDGPQVLERGAGQIADNVAAMLAPFGLVMSPAAAGAVGYLMLCPTPDGVGVHFMVHTEAGPISIIIMPLTPVEDGKRFDFDGMQAELVTLEQGSAAIIARADQDIGGMYDFVRQSILPLPLGS